MLSRYKEINLSTNKIMNIETDCIYYLSEGTAQLWELNSDGSEILINVLKADDAIRLPNVQFNSIYELRTDKEKVLLYIYEWDPFNSSLEEKYFLLSKVTSTLMRTESINFIKRQRFVKNRILSLLHFLVQEYGEKYKGNNYIIKIPLTHEQLASLILSTRTTVTRILNELKKDNVISYTHGHICINQNIIDNMDDYNELLEVV